MFSKTHAEHSTITKQSHSTDDNLTITQPQSQATALIQRARFSFTLPFPGDIVQLQAVIGNRAIGRLLEKTDRRPSIFPALRPNIQNTNLSVSHIMRQRGQRRQTTSAFRQQVYIVRDRSIGLGGGTLVSDLAEFKRRVMRLRNRGDWTLVLAIHGSENRVAAQAPPNWQRNAIFYNADAINRLFSGSAQWVTWRDCYGPNHLALVACQVSIAFERTLISNLTRHAVGSGVQSPAPTQTAQGLGTGCKPLSSTQTLTTVSGRPLQTRNQYWRLSADEQRQILDELKALNSEYGYYGAPPIPEDQVLHYYFREAPSAAWVIVEIGVGQDNHRVQNTHIPFWNRATGPQASRYRRLCDQGVGRLRPRQPNVPPAP